MFLSAKSDTAVKESRRTERPARTSFTASCLKNNNKKARLLNSLSPI